MIKVNDLHVSLNNKAILKNINASIPKGSFSGLIGPNGSGKTTLLKTLSKLIPYDKGEVSIAEKELSFYKHKTLARELSYVPQDTNIDFDFNVKDIVAMGRYAHGTFFNKEISNEAIVKEAMIATNTWRFADKSILSLSGGQRQLVCIAKALAQDTPLILLDEPIAALDIYYQIRILKLLKELTMQGKTVVTVLHDLNLVARFCENVLLLEDGKIKAHGSCKEVLTEQTLQETYQIEAAVREDKLIKTIQITPL
ncbi:ABC transporter ATP-binding protein [Ornithinibacillus sp. 4-3]|uniref:ABC transporter ATP-binding protein n=1 Tax=Ornithinibacillus sp. 4-3 TaxID=3231488 RepID=A0AB39HRZ9_9BACI